MTAINLHTLTSMIEPVQTGEISYTLPIAIAAIVGTVFIIAGVTIARRRDADDDAIIVILLVGVLVGLFTGTIGHMGTSSKHYDRIDTELEGRYGIHTGRSSFVHYNISKAVARGETIILPAMMSDTDPNNMTYNQDTGEYIINKEGAKLRENLVYRITPTTIELMWQDGDTLKPFTETQKRILQSSKSED